MEEGGEGKEERGKVWEGKKGEGLLAGKEGRLRGPGKCIKKGLQPAIQAYFSYTIKPHAHIPNIGEGVVGEGRQKPTCFCIQRQSQKEILKRGGKKGER